MLLIPCPACGTRPEGEFSCLGEAIEPRPDPATLSDGAWAAWLADRANTRGWHRERWWHFRSCGLIFVVERDTVSHAIRTIEESLP